MEIRKARCRTGAALGWLLLTLMAANGPALAAGTRVGNGDDGKDLEGLVRVTKGVLIETRDRAVQKLETLNVQSVPHLGRVIPELKNSEIYLARKDVEAKFAFDRGMEGSPEGDAVYARTFAEPHAATRFFPAALTLSSEQLEALHIHEALHRALPQSARENEEIVSRITLAITSPGASYDRVRETTVAAIDPLVAKPVAASGSGARLSTTALTLAREPNLERPSLIAYQFTVFDQGGTQGAQYPVRSLHSLKSFLHPFGTGSRALGLGVELSYLQLEEKSFMGPVKLSGRLRLTTLRQFDLEGFAEVAFAATDNDLENMPLGRDVTTLGLRAKRISDRFYVENSVGLTLPSDTEETLGAAKYTHAFGRILGLNVRAGLKRSGFEFGGMVDLALAESYTVKGPNFDFDSGRYRVVTAGPEIAYDNDSLRIALRGGWVLDATEDVPLDYLGDIVGRGSGQGFVSSSVGFSF